jgi:hypothetical protein
MALRTVAIGKTATHGSVKLDDRGMEARAAANERRRSPTDAVWIWCMEAAPARLEGSAASRGAAQQAASLNQLSRPSTDSILRVTALVACVVAGLHVMTSRMAQAASMMLMALVSRRNTTVAWRKLMVWSCSMVRLHYADTTS